MRRRSIALLVLAAGLGSATAAPSPDEPGRFAFDPAPDRFRADALLDLRSLNEERAGGRGYVRTTPDGDFVRGDGKPLRFWAVNSFVGQAKTAERRPLWPWAPPDLARHARFLAKRGVNLVRLHAQLSPDPKAKPLPSLEDVNETEREWIWRAVAAYRKEGIYVAISPYWANALSPVPAWGLGTGNGHALLFLEPRLQAAYRAWWKALLVPKNPHTGLPLAKDPGVAFLQLQNEDSLLFWTLNGVEGAPRRRLGERFGAWARQRYGSAAKAVAAWHGDRLPADDVPAGVLDVHNLWHLTTEGRGGDPVRLADETRFLGETMRGFFADTVRFLREDLGCQALVNAGNWRTADEARLLDVERWAYGAGDVVAVNRYFPGVHLGETRGWAIVDGNRFTSPSALRTATFDLPVFVRQVKGMPTVVTEASWPLPNACAVEGPFLVAAYASLAGVDGFCWFATDVEGFSPPRSANGFFPSQAKWEIASPDVLGGFPAAALAFRRGDIARADAAVLEQRPLADLWARVPAALPEGAAYDPNRDRGDRAAARGASPLDPRAFLVGPVLVEPGAGRADVDATDVRRLVDAEGRVSSRTKELTFDAKRGACTIDTPRTQGVVAFFRGTEAFPLATTRVRCGNTQAAVLVTSLDGDPLATSRRVLVQVTTPARPTGWREVAEELRPDKGAPEPGARVESFGRAPWQVERVDLDLVVRNPRLTRARALDANGEATGTVRTVRKDGALELRFPEETLYVVLDDGS